jgi:hypothetical protein
MRPLREDHPPPFRQFQVSDRAGGRPMRLAGAWKATRWLFGRTRRRRQ